MRLFKKIRGFFTALRWCISGKWFEERFINPDYYQSFADAHKDEFAEFKDKMMLSEIKEEFALYNWYFKGNEAATIIRSMNDHEKLYRRDNSVSWLSHGELSYKPYFRTECSSKYLSLYFYLIALNMDDVDFYPNCYFANERGYVPESMRDEPICFELVKDVYSVSSDYKVNIK